MALPALKFEEHESKDVSPGQEDEIRLEWQLRLKPAIKVKNHQDLKPKPEEATGTEKSKAGEKPEGGKAAGPSNEAKSPETPEVPPGEEAGMRAAWQGRARADAETTQASKTNRPRTDIQPTPSLPIQPGQEKKETPEQTEERQESKLARWLRQKQKAKRQARSKEYEASGLSGSVEGKLKKLRQIKKIIRVIRAGSLVGVSLADIFFSLSALFLSLVGEWLISKFIPGYQLFPKDDPLVILDKILWYVGWAVVVSALLLIVALIIIIVYINQAPTNALRLLIS